VEEIGYAESRIVPAYYGMSDWWSGATSWQASSAPIARRIAGAKGGKIRRAASARGTDFRQPAELLEKVSARYSLRWLRFAASDDPCCPGLRGCDGSFARSSVRRMSLTANRRGHFFARGELLAVAPGDCCVVEDSAAGVKRDWRQYDVIAITNSLPAEKLSRATKVSAVTEIGSLLLQG